MIKIKSFEKDNNFLKLYLKQICFGAIIILLIFYISFSCYSIKKLFFDNDENTTYVVLNDTGTILNSEEENPAYYFENKDKLDNIAKTFTEKREDKKEGKAVELLNLKVYEFKYRQLLSGDLAVEIRNISSEVGYIIFSMLMTTSFFLLEVFFMIKDKKVKNDVSKAEENSEKDVEKLPDFEIIDNEEIKAEENSSTEKDEIKPPEAVDNEEISAAERLRAEKDEKRPLSFEIIDSESINKDEIHSEITESKRKDMFGRFVAGVSHEINTPIGAIKAASDAFSANAVKSLERFAEKTRNYDDEEMKILFDIMELSIKSVKKMLSTSEIRRAKYRICEELEKWEVEESAAVAETLARLEICDVEDIVKRKEVFKRTDINEILLSVCDLFFLITGTNTIDMATSKVSRVVYALKAYSTSSENRQNTEEFDLIECIDNVIRLYASQYNSGIEVKKLYDDNIPRIMGNSESLSQVCINLIQNSFYAMKKGGTLTISVKTDAANEFVFIEFRDTGCGIAEEDIGKIFEPLFTTKPIGEGIGLGLDICRKIIESHKGTITVESALNIGTTFYITLPVR